MNLVEESTIVFRLNGQPFVSELSKIESSLQEARDKMALLEKGTKEWTDARRDVKDLEAALETARQQMDVTQLTVKQLTALQGDLVRVMKDSVVGSDEYNAAAHRLAEINPILAEVRQDMRGIGNEAESQKGIWEQFKEDFTRAFSVMSVFEAGKAIYDFVSDSVREFKTFQSSAADLSAVTGLVGDELKYLTDQAKETGPEFGMLGSDMLEAYKMMASAKPELLEQKELLAATTNEAIKLAQASKMELGPATDALASSLNQFGEPASSASRFINVMAAGAKEGSAEIEEMAGALKNSGTVAAASKVSFEQTNAVLQSLSTISLKGGEAGNQLKNVLLTLSAGSKETNPQIVGLDKAIENLGKKQMSTAEIAKMFGKENVVAAQHIVTHGKEITELTKKLTGTTEAYTQAAKNTSTLDFQSKQATATMATLKTEIGAGLEPILVKITAGFITFVNVIRAVPEFISENKTMILALGAAILAFNGQLIIATATSLAYAAVEKARAIATQSVTIAQTALNTVMSANPIGAVIAVIAILVGAFATWYEKSDAVKASVAGLWNTIKTLIAVVSDAFKAFTTFDFGKLSDIFKTGATKIGNSFNEGYNGKMNELRKENDANNKKANDKTATDAKANAKKIAENEQSEHKATLTAKEKAAVKHRADELAKAKEKAKKEKEDGIAQDKQMLAEIKKMDIDSIKEENARNIAKLKLQTQQEIEKIATSKANQSTKAAWEQALNDKLSRDIAELEKKARDEKIADEKKAALEIEKDQDQKRQTRIKNSFDAEKAINEYELITAKNNQDEIQRLKLQRLDIEKRETLQKLQTELDAEKKALKEAYDAEVAKAAASGKDTTELHRQYRTNQMSLDEKYLAQSSLATAQYQQAKTKELEEHNKLRDENNKKFFSGLKGLMDGDYKGFIDGLSAKLGADKKNLSERTSKFMDHTDKVADYANEGFDFLRKLNDLKLQKDVNNLTKEKNEQLKAWEEKYNKGLITKDQFEAKTDELNKQYAAKEQQLRKEAFEKQKKMDIAQALINGAQAIIKSLAMFGWPFGLIAAAAAGVMTGVQVASISSRTFAQKGAVIKNAGVAQGPRHGSKYGESGISLVDRSSGHEIGEMEGGEPIMILSRNTYQNNKPVVDKLLDSSLHKNGAPIYREGGLMFSDGGSFDERMQERIREKREEERQDSEEQQQREEIQDNAAVTAGDGNSPAYNSGLGDTSAQESAIAENTKLQEDIRKNGADAVQELKDVNVAERAILDVVKALRDDINRLLGSINNNTANTAKSTKDMGALVAFTARFK
ncbi:phage tail tape measure protein [Arcicella aquatica]|uniref:Phage tail tape measure protein n=1 Tax=Arcicella aquatica TaxID=217141 RepID=A0ABU5QJC1_9BACT|nr:phage tail tape measure protein [Arcicella aquatica]MEA5257160.1 phage tail tape measure protein [Arcicella aquatica]